MSRRKTAACKFIEAKTMVIPKPGKFPDVENKPIKSDTSGTDNIEDQKYQDKTAAAPPGGYQSGSSVPGIGYPSRAVMPSNPQKKMQNLLSRPAPPSIGGTMGEAALGGMPGSRHNPGVAGLLRRKTESPGADINPGGAEHMPNLTTPGADINPGGAEHMPNLTTPGPAKYNRPGPDGRMGTPDDAFASKPPKGGFDPRLGPSARPGPDGVMGTQDDGTGPNIGSFRKQNSANNLMRQAIKQAGNAGH